MKALTSSVVAIMFATSICRTSACRQISCAFVARDVSHLNSFASTHNVQPFTTSNRAEEKQSSVAASGGGIKKYKKKQPRLLRADRVISDRGVGTRSQTSKLLRQRRISLLDPNSGKLVGIKGPSEKVHPEATLFLDGKELPGLPPVILIYHKPKLVLSAMHDKEGRSHLGEKLDECKFPTKNMHPVGRLDYETTGLILFSSSGDLTQRLLHPRRGVEKEYVARVEGIVDEDSLRNKLNAGVETAEGIHEAGLLEVIPVSEADNASRDDTENNDDDSSNEPETDAITDLTDVRVVVTEGKHRMVRRMLANCGHPVVELRRERHGEVRLGDLSTGEFRQPTESEIAWAESLLQ